MNDNGRSYSPTIGGLASHLADLRVTQGYENALDLIKKTVPRAPVVGNLTYEALHGIKKGLKDVLQPQAMFEDLGMKYVGPIDGHDADAVERALRRARGFGRPVIVHCITTKGRGYAPAENDTEDCMHGGGAFDPATGRFVTKKGGPAWTKVFGEEMVAIGRERRDVVGITAAMLYPTGLAPFAGRSRTASSTSASPSSTPSRPRRASRWPGCTRSWPCTRRSSTARSTRSSWTPRCTGSRSRSPWTAPA